MNANILSKHHIDDLLVMFFCLVADESSFSSEMTSGGEVVDKRMLLLQVLTLLTSQCKASCRSRMILNIQVCQER